jgi:hypothetical protein
LDPVVSDVRRPIHVIPLNDEREHAVSSWCWCGPDLGDEGDDDTPSVYVHHAADGREDREPCRGGLWACIFED